MKKLLYSLLAIATLAGCASYSQSGWYSLFDGKSLKGWQASESPNTFTVKDGQLVVKGDRAHLFYVGSVNHGNFTNFEFKAEVMTFPKANSGVYFHTKVQGPGWPSTGYEVQVNNTHGDPKKTAGLYAIDDNFVAPAKDGEWFTLRIKVQGKHIVTQVNGQVIKDYIEPENPTRPQGMEKRLVSNGTIAIQGHDPGSEVHYRNIQIKPLP